MFLGYKGLSPVTETPPSAGVSVMRWLKPRWLTLLVVGLTLLWIFLPWQAAYWVGRTDLTVEFRVVDADTDSPLGGATLRFRPETSGFCREKEVGEFTLTTGADGRAVLARTECMCFGRETLWGWNDSYGLHLPPLWFWAEAPGYQESGLSYLDDPPFHRALRRVVGPEADILKVRVPLRKSPGA
jgi:hypothetical protein